MSNYDQLRSETITAWDELEQKIEAMRWALDYLGDHFDSHDLDMVNWAADILKVAREAVDAALRFHDELSTDDAR